MSEPTKVLCVYRSGGDYSPDDVVRLARGVHRHGGGATLTCLTDDMDGVREASTVEKFPTGLRLEPLIHDWPGWWSKLEVFRFPGPCLYMDLDTVVVGDLGPLLKAAADQPGHGLMMLDGFYRPEKCSGIMGWSGYAKAIYDAFDDIAASAKWITRSLGQAMEDSNGKIWSGDQNWIRENMLGPVTIAQHLVDGIISYKVHVVGLKKGPPARLVCFHGQPRPWDALDGVPNWLREAMVA